MPFPSPSRTPENVTETEDTTNPKLMILSAAPPISIVARLVVNNPISCCGIAQEIAIPITITSAINPMEVCVIFFTLSYSPAP